MRLNLHVTYGFWLFCFCTTAGYTQENNLSPDATLVQGYLEPEIKGLYAVEPAPLPITLSAKDITFFNENRCKIQADKDSPSVVRMDEADDCKKKIQQVEDKFGKITDGEHRKAFVYTMMNNYYYMTRLYFLKRGEIGETIPKGYRYDYFVSGTVSEVDANRNGMMILGYSEAYLIGIQPAPNDLTTNNPNALISAKEMPFGRELAGEVTPVKQSSVILIVKANKLLRPKQKLKQHGLHHVMTDVMEDGTTVIYGFTPVIPPEIAKVRKSISLLDKEIIHYRRLIRASYSNYASFAPYVPPRQERQILPNGLPVPQ